MDKKEIVVFGQRRSGTSMFAGILYYLGVPMGKEAVPDQKSERNPNGFFEDRSIIKISEDILREIDEGLKRSEQLTFAYLHIKYGERIRKAIEERKKDKVWGFKDVNQLQLHRLYQRYLENPHYIFVYRNPIDIAKSLHSWHSHIPFAECIRSVFSNYNIMMGYWQNLKAPVFHASYESALRNPENMVDSIIDFLKLKPTKEQRQKAIEHIKTK